MSGARELDAAAAARMQHWMVLLSRKWTLPLLDVLGSGPVRYNGLLGALEPIAPIVLTDALRRLEAGGLVESQREGRVACSYGLTRDGRFVLETTRELYRRTLAQGSLS